MGGAMSTTGQADGPPMRSIDRARARAETRGVVPTHKARLGLLCLPRSVASAVTDARLAEDVGFSLVGVADSQSVFRERARLIRALGEQVLPRLG
jgi:hypothetical protein